MESDAHFDYKSSIDDWADKYEKAQADGVFKDADNHIHTPSSQVMNNGFFGHQQGDPTDDVSDADALYWAQVAKLSDKNSFQPEIMTENTVKDVQKKFSSVVNSANPIPPNTVGPDSGPISSGVTYAPEDIQELIDLKNQMFELQNKMIALQDSPKVKKYEDQIKTIQDKYDELSDAVNNGFVLSQQGS